MRYIVSRDNISGASRKLGYAALGLSCVLAGSGALAWQNSNTKLRTARIEEAAPATMINRAEDQPATEVEVVAPAKPVVVSSPAAKTVSASPATDALPPIINAPSATPYRAGYAPATTSPTTAATTTVTTATPATSTARKLATAKASAPSGARTASKEKSKSFFPFTLPGFGGSTAKPEDNDSNSAPARRFRASASAKALGNSSRVSRPVSEPNADEGPVAIVADKAQPTGQPTPARRAADMADSSGESIERVVVKPQPVAKPQPIVKPVDEPVAVKVATAPVQPTRIVVTTPRPKVTRPQLTKIASALAPLAYTPIKDVRPAGFQEVTPGQSKLTEISQHLGEPISTEHQGTTTVMTYELGPFPKVEVILVGDVVDSVVIHLAEAADEADVLTELGLSEFQTVEVTDSAGAVLGVAVPERGVALSFQDDGQDRQVSEVVLATITAEPFLLRAASESENRYGQMLADVEFALGLDPKNAEAHAIRARILTAVGRASEARLAVEQAIKLDAGSADYRLLYADLLAATGDYNNALKMVETIATTPSVPPEYTAQAELQWGQLLADGPQHDYPAAVEHLTKAIKLATPLAQSESASIRRASLRTLLDANLAVGCAVATGNYKRKQEVVPKWLHKADAIALLAIQDGADPYLQLYVPAKKLAAYMLMEEPLDPTSAVDAALSAGQELIGDATDPLYQQQLEWELGTALLAAVQIEHTRGKFDLAIQYANNALVLLSDNAEHREPTAERDYLLGQMFFATGAIYAIGMEDHAEAVHYYLQAQPLLAKGLPIECQNDAARHGERFVSMGVSYWQNGNKDQAIELTLGGVELLNKAIANKQADHQALAVPYNNLAAMYRQLGNANEATKYMELAKRLEPNAAVKR